MSIRWRSMVILAVLALVIAACGSSTSSSSDRPVGRAAFGSRIRRTHRPPRPSP